MRNLWLALRSLFWTVAFPGFMAGYVPWRYFDVSEVDFDFSNPRHVLGGVLILVGTALLLTCIFEFARSGRGTLSPADPPKELVVQGLYRYVRNPMYVGVLMCILGHFLWFGYWVILGYAGIFFLVVHSFVTLYEEPDLRKRFGAGYEEYLTEVPRWIPRFK